MSGSRTGRAGWLEVGDRIWVRRYEFADETCAVIGSLEGLVVVDTRPSHRHADQLLADIHTLSTQPVIAAVNTHGHWDHCFGNARFEHVPIWGHSTCPVFMAQTGPAMRARLLTMDLTAEEAGAVAEVHITPPTRLFDDCSTLNLGDRQVHLRHLGRGHTDNDIVVRTSDSTVTIVGDLIKSNGPPGYRDAFPVAWAATARRLVELVDGPVVPGHGDVVDEHFAEHQAEQIAQVAHLVSAVVRGEMHRPEALSRSPVHPDAFQQAIGRARIELATQPPA